MLSKKPLPRSVPAGRPAVTMSRPRSLVGRQMAPSMKAEGSSTSTSIRLQELELAKKAAEHEAEILREQVQQVTMRMEASENHHKSAKLVMEQMLSCKEQLLEEKTCKIAEQEKTNAALQQQLQNFTLQLQDTQQLVEEGHQMRKKLHNTIQELKGNIRVMARVRGPEAKETCFSFPDKLDGRVINITAPATTNYAGDEKAKILNFSFDKVFAADATQGIVFEEIAQLVQSALDGYKVTIFAYGQTGSGKTFTMEGPPSPTEETSGMIPRAVAQIFEEAARLQPRGWEFTLQATFVEIYLEEVRDLLGSAAGGTGPSAVKHEIHHKGDGSTEISNVITITVKKPADVFKLLQTAARNRATAATKMNERSSRSHSVFTLKISGLNATTDQKSSGVLNLIDLAGSERLNASGATGDRLKETQNINKSLAALGDVIGALGTKKGHVPFRNSKLTYLLQNCLGGDGKTLMFVNISPEANHLQESICSLRFAAKVNSCEIGTAKRKVQ